MNQENVEQLLKRVENLGFSDYVKDQIKENMKEGMIGFTALESIKIGNHKVDYELHFAPGKNNHEATVFLNEVDVLLEKPVDVKHTVIDGVHTQAIENLLLPISSEDIPDHLKNDKAHFEHEQQVEAQKQMKWLMEENPSVFNALVLKHNPNLEFEIPEKLQKEQQDLQKDSIKYNKFSTYFNLTALEMYNVMEERATLKNLFKTTSVKNEVQPDNEENNEKVKNPSFTSWVKADFDNRRANGSLEMILIPQAKPMWDILKEFNFDETNNKNQKKEVVRFLEKGSQVVVTALSVTGDQKIKIEANPEQNGIKLYHLNGEPIHNQKPFLKNQYKVEMGTVVEIKRANHPGEPLAADAKALNSDEKQTQSEKFKQHRNSTVAEANSEEQRKKNDPKGLNEKNSASATNEVKLKNRQGKRIIKDDNSRTGMRV